MDTSRRELIAIAAVAASARSATAGPLRFFTAQEFAVVDELCELIIPEDEHSGGAKAARVAEYIDRVLGEAFEQKERDEFRAGLKPYVTAGSKARREQMLAAEAPKEGDTFFRVLKKHTVHGYYTSKIGIHDELGYKGNVLQQRDYAGELP